MSIVLSFCSRTARNERTERFVFAVSHLFRNHSWLECGGIECSVACKDIVRRYARAHARILLLLRILRSLTTAYYKRLVSCEPLALLQDEFPSIFKCFGVALLYCQVVFEEERKADS